MTIYISHNYSQASVAIGWEQSGTNLQSPPLFVRSNGIQWKSFHYGNENFCFFYARDKLYLFDVHGYLACVIASFTTDLGKITYFSLNSCKII